MSNILKAKEDFKYIKELVDELSKHGVSRELISSALNILLPRKDDKILVGSKFSRMLNYPAYYDPRTSDLVINIMGLWNWLTTNSLGLLAQYEIKDRVLLDGFLLLFVLAHEIEHSYEHLMGNGIVVAPCTTLVQGYKGLFELFEKKDYIIPRPIRQTRRIISLISYKLNENGYILERNANLEALDLVCQMALYMDREDIFNIFDILRKNIMRMDM